jgi:hypothetical protein
MTNWMLGHKHILLATAMPITGNRNPYIIQQSNLTAL